MRQPLFVFYILFHKQLSECLPWNRPRIIKALYLITVKLPQDFHLILLLHAFCKNLHSQTVSQCNGMPYHLTSSFILHVVDQTLIQLQRIKRQLVKTGQR